MVLTYVARLTAPPSQTLQILAPTPSTVSFTVSTRPVRATLAAKLGHYAGFLARALAGLCAIALLWVKWSLEYGSAYSIEVLLWVLGGPRTASLLKAVGGFGWAYVGPAAAVVLWQVLRRGYTGKYFACMEMG